MPKPFQIQTLDDILGKSSNQPAPANNTPSDDAPPSKPPTKFFEELHVLASTTPTQSPYDDFDKEIRYMRWLAFYYLSKKELSKHQLKEKLLAKGCNSSTVDDLLNEFKEKGYQSDERCAIMIIKENLRKGRGKRYTDNALAKARLFFDEDELTKLIGQAGGHLSEHTILDNNQTTPSMSRHDWLKLAVETRSKKYGTLPPKDPKDKARQLRFLQYRGFESDICFEALKLTLDDFDD